MIENSIWITKKVQVGQNLNGKLIVDLVSTLYAGARQIG